MSGIKKIHWSQLPFNSTTTQLDLKMLLPEGFKKNQYLATVKRTEKEWHEVLYDKDFVKHKIREVILKPLGTTSLPGLIKILENFSIYESDNIPFSAKVSCRVYRLHGERVVRVKELEAKGIEVDEL